MQINELPGQIDTDKENRAFSRIAYQAPRLTCFGPVEKIVQLENTGAISDATAYYTGGT